MCNCQMPKLHSISFCKRNRRSCNESYMGALLKYFQGCGLKKFFLIWNSKQFLISAFALKTIKFDENIKIWKTILHRYWDFTLTQHGAIEASDFPSHLIRTLIVYKLTQRTCFFYVLDLKKVIRIPKTMDAIYEE